MTIFELLMVITIIGVSTSVAISRLSAPTRTIDAVSQELVANLRLCRMKAISTGYHCRINVSSTASYRVERMLPPATQGGNWTADTAQSRAVNLPPAVRFGATGAYEFDSRGTVVRQTSTATVTLADSGQQRTLSIVIWPSGQVE
jgi:Tfp pilus assembly protein FimT